MNQACDRKWERLRMTAGVTSCVTYRTLAFLLSDKKNQCIILRRGVITQWASCWEGMPLGAVWRMGAQGQELWERGLAGGHNSRGAGTSLGQGRCPQCRVQVLLCGITSELLN